jgi:hypothetical protein
MEVETEVNTEETEVNQLKFEINLTDQPNTIIDYQSQNKNEVCHFLYLLMGIDKLHDFGDHFTKIYDLIYQYYFLYNNSNKLLNISGQKIIGSGEDIVAEQNLKNKVNTLHKLIDFLSYKTNLPIRDAPILKFNIKDNDSNTYIIDSINTKAPFTMNSVKITDLDTNDKINDYKSKIRPERDVLLYFTGRKSHFKNTIGGKNILSKILDIPDGGEYVSKDAFPMSNDIINSIFKRDPTRNFQSYTSQLMDPATQTKDIVSVEKQIKTLFCILTNDKKLFLNASLNNKQITLNFTINEDNRNGVPFTIVHTTPTPSIQDVVIYLYYIEANEKKESKALKALKANYGAKIMNLFKTNKKKQNEIANNLKMNYFDKLINAVPVPDGDNLPLEDKQLIAISSKTIGDQTYLWDSLIHDSSPSAERSPQGSFVATVDSFLFEQIVHGKNANAIFASKINDGTFRDMVLGSNYQMVIYLKPSKPEDAAAYQAAQEELLEKIKEEYGTLLGNFKDRLAGINIATIRINFNDKRKSIVDMLVNMFNKIEPYDSSGRIPRIPKSYQLTIDENISENDNNESKMDVDGEEFKEDGEEFKEGPQTIYPSPINISNYYYAACYLLHFIIQCEISLSKVSVSPQLNEDISDINNIQTLQNKLISLKGIINTYDDALSYYDNTLMSINNIIQLYEYLKNNEVSSEDVTPDFENIRNSLNQNKSRLEYYLNKKLPNTIGFSKCFFAIKDHVKKFFESFLDITFKGNSPSTIEGVQQLGGNNIPREAFEQIIIDVFPPRKYYNTHSNSNNIFNDCDIEPMDYYELFYLLKQLYYDDYETPTDEFYADLYTFINNKLSEFNIFIRNNILYYELHKEILEREIHNPKRLKKGTTSINIDVSSLPSTLPSTPPSTPPRSSRPSSDSNSSLYTIEPSNTSGPSLKRKRGGKKTKRKRKEKHNKMKKTKRKHKKSKRKTKRKHKK